MISSFFLFIFAIVTLRLPPIYLLPIKNYLSSSHTLASLLIIIISLVSIYRTYKYRAYPKQDKLELLLISFYLLSITISIIPAINNIEFVRYYKNIFLAVLIYELIPKLFKNENQIKKLGCALFISSLVNIAFQICLYFKPQPIYNLLTNVIYEPQLQELLLDESIGRFFAGLFFDGALITFFFTLIHSRKLINKISFYPWLITISIFAQLSNFRITLIVIFINIIGVLVINAKKTWAILIIVSLTLGLTIGNIMSYQLTGMSALNRLTIINEESVGSIKSRFYLWQKATDMWNGSKIFGVGLGNYYDRLLPRTEKSLVPSSNELQQSVKTHPHNLLFAVMAETGSLGLISTIMLQMYFMFTDIHFYKKLNNISRSLVWSYWSLFVSSLTGPRIILPYLALIWLIRGLISQQRIILRSGSTIRSKQF